MPETYRRVRYYQGYWIIYYNNTKRYGIEGSVVYLVSEEVAIKIIDNLIKSKSESIT